MASVDSIAIKENVQEMASKKDAAKKSLLSRSLKIIICVIATIIAILLILRALPENEGTIERLAIWATPDYYKECSDDVGNNGYRCPNKIKRLFEYCTFNVPTGAEGPVFPRHDEYELNHLLIFIRHGDRSSIHKLNDAHSSPLSTDSIQSGYLDPRAIKFRSQLPPFIVSALDKFGERIVPTSADLGVTMDQRRGVGIPDLSLPQGQLTSQGFMQHIHLGQLLGTAYKEYLSAVTSPSELYIRSTNYNRTVLSSMALVSGMFPKFSDSQAMAAIDIKSYDNEEDEVMHGVGLRLSSHGVTATSGERVTSGKCSRASVLAKREKQAFRPSASTMASLKAIFGPDIENRPITDLVDASLPKLCHKLHLPCRAKSQSNEKGEGKNEGAQGQTDPSECLGIHLLSDMMTDADRLLCNRYTGRDGGLNSTLLSIYPFLHEAFAKHTVAVARAPRRSTERLALFSGHDTVIAPVLSALGLYQHMCRWPAYASRIVFELWLSKSSRKGPTEDALLSRKGGRKKRVTVEEGEPEDTAFVRVLFNGRDVTQLIPACHEEHVSKLSQSSYSNLKGSSSNTQSVSTSSTTAAVAVQNPSPHLCSLQAITRQIRLVVDKYGSFEKACQG